MTFVLVGVALIALLGLGLYFMPIPSDVILVAGMVMTTLAAFGIVQSLLWSLLQLPRWFRAFINFDGGGDFPFGPKTLI